jgi:hypothetical protein
MENFDHYLREHFPEPTDAAVIRNVMMGVGLADDLRRNTPWASTLIGDDLTGLLRRAAAMWRVRQACIDGELPFQAHEIPNSTGSSHLLKITSGPFEAHVVRTESSGAFPKDAPIRQDNRLTNDRDLFNFDDPKIVSFQEMVGAVDNSYAWLTFNATEVGALTHVCWGMPKANENKYLAHIDILRRAMSVGTPIAPATPPKPDPKDQIKFKRHVEEKIERSKKKDDNKKA